MDDSRLRPTEEVGAAATLDDATSPGGTTCWWNGRWRATWAPSTSLSRPTRISATHSWPAWFPTRTRPVMRPRRPSWRRPETCARTADRHSGDGSRGSRSTRRWTCSGPGNGGRCRRTRLEDDSWQPPAGSESDPESIATTGERQRALVAAMGAIGADQRTAIVLYDVEGYDYGEIAEMTGVSLGTVKSREPSGPAGAPRAACRPDGTLPQLRTSPSHGPRSQRTPPPPRPTSTRRSSPPSTRATWWESIATGRRRSP